MATRADYYIQDSKGVLEFLGSTVNDYCGDFEKAKTVTEYRKFVVEKLIDNKSEFGKWYWPWKNSVITDEVFIFRHTPMFLNKRKGVLLTKVYHKNKDYDGDILGFMSVKKAQEYQDDEGYHPENMIELIQMPNLKD